MTTSVALSGARGFIGRHVTSALESKGISVDEIEDAHLFAPGPLKTRPKAVIHLAAVSSAADFAKDIATAYKVNVLGTLSMLRLAQSHGAHFVFASSSAVYGSVTSSVVNETQASHPISSYGKSKLMGELLCQDFAAQAGLPVTVLRFFNIYGPGQRPSFIIPYIVSGAVKGEALSLKNPTARRDFLHVSDLSHLIASLVATKREGYHVFNVGSGKATSVLDIVHLTEKRVGRAVPWARAKSKGPKEVKQICADIRRLRGFMKWKPKIAIADGIAQLVDEFRQANA